VSLPWIRLDTQFPHNPKVLLLAESKQWRAVVLYVNGLCYAGGQGTDGYIPRLALPLLHGTKRDAEQLVDVGLWVPNPTGWDIHGWLDKQASSEEHAARKARAKAAAMNRWHGKEASGE
jgi:hypothetical protein